MIARRFPPPPAVVLAPLLLAAAMATAPALVVSLDFEEAPIPAAGTQIGIPEYIEDGFHIQPLGPLDTTSPFRLRRNGGSSTGSPENGTPYLQLATGDSFEMSQLSSAAFAPVSVDIAEYSDLFASLPTSVTFEGFFSDLSSVSVTFITDGMIDGTGPVDDFETFLFPAAFAGIVRLEVAEIPDPLSSFSLDRLLVNNVPEPARVLLSLLAFTIASLQRRRGLLQG